MPSQSYAGMPPQQAVHQTGQMPSGAMLPPHQQSGLMNVGMAPCDHQDMMAQQQQQPTPTSGPPPPPQQQQQQQLQAPGVGAVAKTDAANGGVQDSEEDELVIVGCSGTFTADLPHARAHCVNRPHRIVKVCTCVRDRRCG